ncbi:MAG: hypothetical protein GXO80_04750 [Chlorobi bacterium]|nr:hypothetical protein [Chlorobiota bacterium]
MEILFKINIKDKIIYETWPESVSFEDYSKMKNKQFSHPDFDAEFNVITDLRKVDMKFDESFILNIISFIKENSDFMMHRKSALVADSPQLVASSLFFGQRMRDLPVKVSIFSTLEAAIKWVKEKWR